MPFDRPVTAHVVPVPVHIEAVVNEPKEGPGAYWTVYPVIALDPTVAGAVQTKFTPVFAGDPLTPVGIPGTPLV